jgi:sialic acid synthase SpsE
VKRLSIGEREIGEGRPCFIVAELGCNHQGDPALAARMIETAAVCGVDAIKLQRRDIDSILTRQAQEAPYVNERSFGSTYGAHRRALELPDEAWRRLQSLAQERGLVFFATPYDPLSVEFLATLRVPVVKIASCDVTNPPLLEAAAGLGVPVILSTGMSTEEEIDHAVRLIWRHTTDLVLMHCVSTYPASNDELNLRYMRKLRNTYAVLVGNSGHERGIATSVAAVVLGAVVIERHFTLDRSLRGPDHSASLEPEGLRRLVRDIRNVEVALVERPKHLLPSEEPVRARLAKSLATCRRIEAGEVLERSALCCKGPGTGLSPVLMDEVVGKRARRAIAPDTILLAEMLR